ncbi:MAG: hypothetical protein ACRD8W_22975 [Nitrososphaeraceae archaeon]
MGKHNFTRRRDYDKWYTEEELGDEWKENPGRHSSNCYFVGDVTPQEVERVYQESLK